MPSLTPPRSALPRATSYNGSRNQGTQRLVCDLGGIMVAQDGSSCTIPRPSGLRNTMPREQDDPHSRTPTTSWMTAVLHPGTPLCLGLPDNLTAAGPPIASPPCCIVRTYAALLVASARLFFLEPSQARTFQRVPVSQTLTRAAKKVLLAGYGRDVDTVYGTYISH